MFKSLTVHRPTVRSASTIVHATPFYYGWIIMLAGTLGMVMTSPGQTYAVSVFIEHFIAELGISRGLVSTLYAIGTMTGSFALPFVGRQIDRRGARAVAVVVAVLFGGACLYMGQVRNALMLGIGFVLIRMLGQGSLSLVSTNLINNWWIRRRGVVLGLSGVIGALLGTGSFPLLLGWLIPLVGWRWTYVMLGFALWTIMVPVIVFFFREQPEMFGLLPDGRRPKRKARADSLESSLEQALESEMVAELDEDSENEITEDNWTLAEARNTGIFWILAASIATISMMGTGLTFHMVSIVTDSGLDEQIAIAVFAPLSVAVALSALLGGWLIDRFPARGLLAVALVLQGAALLLAQVLSSVALALAYGALLGVMMGLQRAVSSVAWAKYFGRLHLGAITGVATTIGVAASALGPMPFGLARDAFGSYGLVLTLSALLPFGLAVAALFVKEPRRE